MAVAGALIWISAVVLRLEQAEIHARAEADHEASLQRALWRLDSWLSVFLARESARPYTDYLPLEPAGSAGSPLRLATAGGVAPSPLRNLESDYIELHFHADPVTGISSPQLSGAPEGGTRHEAWRRLLPYLDLNRIRDRVVVAESLPTTKLANAARPGAPGAGAMPEDAGVRTDFEARVSCTVPPAPGETCSSGICGGDVQAAGIIVDVGPLIPLWLVDPATGTDYELVFVRRLEALGKEFLQGFFGDWPRLEERLLAEILELVPGAELIRVSPGSVPVEPRRRYLANLPAQLVAGAAPSPAAPGASSARVILGLAWLMTIGAALTIGITLHKSIELGERRKRFVSSVTHELRTPLTTFRMYSDLERRTRGRSRPTSRSSGRSYATWWTTPPNTPGTADPRQFTCSPTSRTAR